MSTIENKSQTKKAFKKYPQDHGDAAQQGEHFKDTWYVGRQRSAFDKNDIEKFKTALTDAGTDHQSMSPAELEAWTDQLLGDSYDQGDYSFYASATNNDERNLTNEELSIQGDGGIVEEYQSLMDQRLKLLEQIEEESNKQNSADIIISELTELVTSIEDQANLIEVDVFEILNQRDRLPTEAEFDVLSKKQIRDNLAQQATLGYCPDDDPGYPGYGITTIRIKNQP